MTSRLKTKKSVPTPSQSPFYLPGGIPIGGGRISGPPMSGPRRTPMWVGPAITGPPATTAKGGPEINSNVRSRYSC